VLSSRIASGHAPGRWPHCKLQFQFYKGSGHPHHANPYNGLTAITAEQAGTLGALLFLGHHLAAHRLPGYQDGARRDTTALPHDQAIEVAAHILLTGQGR
jgi:hypothetical protein